MSVGPLERAAVDRDQVGHGAGIARGALGLGDPAVEPEQVLARRRLVVDGDADVVEQLGDVGRQRVECVGDPRLEAFASLVHASSVVSATATESLDLEGETVDAR